MTGSARFLAAVAAALAAIVAGAQQPAARAPSATLPDSLSGRAQVTYLSGSTVYVGAGTLDGLWTGSRVVVLRGDAIVAELKVKYLSSHSAACERAIGYDSAAVNVSDSVRYSRARAESVAVARAAASGGGYSSQKSALRSIGVFGRIGVSYQLVHLRDSMGGSITQPGIDVNLVGTNVGGSPFSFVIDTRSRQTYSTTPGGSTSNNQLVHVYQAALTWADPKSGAAITAGRQVVAALSSVTFFDGVTAQLNKKNWTFGAIGGTQPDPVTLSFSSAITQYGAYVQLHNANTFVPGQPIGPRWSVTTGAIGSYDHGAINREFAFVQGFYADSRLTLYATQEIDYNRGWKSYVGLPTISPTSTFATANLLVSNWMSFYGGFDNRRNVLLYRDYTSPETSFDDAFREGVWGGLSFMVPVVRLGGDARHSTGGPEGSADAYTGWISADRGLPLQMAFRVRTTRYTSMHTDGWLYAGSFGLNASWRARFEANGGWRTETDPTLGAVSPTTYVRWLGVDASIGISRSWFLILSGMRTEGGIESNDQLYASLSYRF